ncbi:MAG: ABC transporter substrate-binding protein [Candidatus Aminicenantales bacterium]
MRKLLFLLLVSSLLPVGCHRSEEPLYTIGIFQVNDAPHLNQARQGFVRALEENGFIDGVNINLITRNGNGDIAEVQKIAQEFVRDRVDMICALSTPCLQAALNASRNIPIVFTSVANPYRAGAGKSPEDHLSNVTGIASTGPIREALSFIREVMPSARRIGTLWTPSELNSEFYLELCREEATRLGFEVEAVPVTNRSAVLLSAQVLANKKIDAMYQISDNTINASFEAVGRVAEENRIPLFGGFLLSTQAGACAAMGWDFFDMGYRTGKIAIRIKEGENPSRIPIQYMSEIKLYLNLKAAEVQGITFSPEIIKRAAKIMGKEEDESESGTYLDRSE